MKHIFDLYQPFLALPGFLPVSALFYTIYIRLLRGWLGALVVEESCLTHEHGDGLEAQIVF